MYRRRRLAVALAATMLVLGVVGGVSAIGNAVGGAGREDEDQRTAAEPTPSPTATPTPTPTPTATPGYQPVRCEATALEITEAAGQTAVPAGEPVDLDLRLTNAGTVPCLLEVGSATLGVVIFSGSDRIWSSTDCPDGPAERLFLLDTGAAAELTVQWDQKRSAPGCPDGRPTAQPGTYRALVTVDGGGTAALGWERVFTVGDPAP